MCETWRSGTDDHATGCMGIKKTGYLHASISWCLNQMAALNLEAAHSSPNMISRRRKKCYGQRVRGNPHVSDIYASIKNMSCLYTHTPSASSSSSRRERERKEKKEKKSIYFVHTSSGDGCPETTSFSHLPGGVSHGCQLHVEYVEHTHSLLQRFLFRRRTPHSKCQLHQSLRSLGVQLEAPKRCSLEAINQNHREPSHGGG